MTGDSPADDGIDAATMELPVIFIDLDRRFHLLTDSELEDAERLAAQSDYGLGMGWPELLEHYRLILLAQAGAGKTSEMSQRAKRLVEEGRFAFFIALESLDRDPVEDVLFPKEIERFEAWKADDEAPAWFFLDAVDELKLTGGKLERALRRLSKALQGCLDRARITISCRPSDWRPHVDAVTVKDILPMPARGVGDPSKSSEQAFLEALRRESDGATSASHKEQDIDDQDVLRTVVMLSMGDGQIERFARQSGVRDATAFLAEVRRQGSWIFASRPLDLAELITSWKCSDGRLGNRAEQHETNVATKLKDDPNRRDNSVLANDRARTGAERLALALALTRNRTIQSPEQAPEIDRDDGILDPARILSDWTEAERQALLRRALFDPATYGRVRFHHRSIQEYLAARRLRALRERGMGMSIKALLRLLFAERYGVKVVFPSMRAIAAWLALWNDDVRRELIEREPETLLSLGDPESLDMAARAKLVHGFAAAYGKGRSRHLNIPIPEVRRFAHPDLARVIRECWNDQSSNEDVRELLIEMIGQGRIINCADLIHDVAFDDDCKPYHRVIAIRALVACDRRHDIAALSEALLDESSGWPDRVVHGVVAHLFPRFITAEQLATLMERTREPKQVGGGFELVSWQIVEELELKPLSEPAVALRDKFADLVWRGRSKETTLCEIHSRFEYLAPALATLCNRQMDVTTDKSDAALVRASVIACRFSGLRGNNSETVTQLRAHVAADANLRKGAFWAELAFVDEIKPTDDARHRFGNALDDMHGSLVSRLTSADRPWLTEALEDERQLERRAVALHALIDIWRQNGRRNAGLDTIRAGLKGNAALERILNRWTAPPERDESRERIQLERLRQRTQAAREEEERLEGCKKWRDGLIANPADAFSAKKVETTLANLYRWLRATKKRLARYDVWDKNGLAKAFDADVAVHAEKAFITRWRATRPELWSERPTDERNHHAPENWILGLMGISAEAQTSGWATKLSPEEAVKAAIYATIELNAFPPFVTDLAMSHPVEVGRIIGGEAKAQITMGDDHDHLPILHCLEHANDAVKRLCLPALLETLQRQPSVVNDDASGRWSHHVDQVLRLLDAVEEGTERETIAEECLARFKTAPAGPMALAWLRGLFRFDAVQGAETLIDAFERDSSPSGSGVRARAIDIFAALFGDHRPVRFDVPDPARRAYLLGRLVRYAYAFVRPADDQVHEGPNTRDHAERARSALFHWLLDTPGPETWRIVREIADDDEFAESSDYFRFLARQRAATDAEFEPYTPGDVSALEERYEIPPKDRDGLFDLLLDRLKDLAYDLRHHDLSDRPTVRRIKKEKPDMQLTIAWRLCTRANGAYTVTREEEVAEGKQPDIRLSAVGTDQKVAVEIKIADNGWSLNDLEYALRKQLVGQYLRHSNCTAGCLLLTYHGRKRYWIDPATRKRIVFRDVVSFLKEKAAEIERERPCHIRVAVFGLDLSDF